VPAVELALVVDDAEQLVARARGARLVVRLALRGREERREVQSRLDPHWGRGLAERPPPRDKALQMHDQHLGRRLNRQLLGRAPLLPATCVAPPRAPCAPGRERSAAHT